MTKSKKIWLTVLACVIVILTALAFCGLYHQNIFLKFAKENSGIEYLNDSNNSIRITGSWKQNDKSALNQFNSKNSLNRTVIYCDQTNMSCTEDRATIEKYLVDSKDSYNLLSNHYEYKVVSWANSKIEAESSGNSPEVEYFLTVDLSVTAKSQANLRVHDIPAGVDYLAELK